MPEIIGGLEVRCYIQGLRVPRRIYTLLGRVPGNFLFWIGGYEQSRPAR